MVYNGSSRGRPLGFPKKSSPGRPEHSVRGGGLSNNDGKWPFITFKSLDMALKKSQKSLDSP